MALALTAPATASVIQVNTAADEINDDGKCALREAIQATNVNQSVNGGDDCKHVQGDTGPDLIYLPDDLYPVDGVAGDDDNTTGDLDIEAGERLEIRGDGIPTLDSDLDRLVELESGKLILTRLELTGGDAGAERGGGALVSGPARLVLDHAIVSESSGERGGGVAVSHPEASLTVKRSTISGNTANGPAATDGGGGIHFSGARARIDRSTVSGNEATLGQGGGLAVGLQSGGFTVTRSLILDNHADARAGGGIYHEPFGGGTLRVSRSLIGQNTARFAGGGLAVGDDSATAVVRRSTVSFNGLSSTLFEFIGGGGISNAGVTRLRDSIVVANTLASPNGMATMVGTGIRNDNGVEMTIAGALIRGNDSANAQGGGIYSAQPLEMTNATISANDAGTGAGAGLYAIDPVSAAHITFSENEANGTGDAIFGSGPISLRASIVANGANACDDPVQSGGFNLEEGMSCGLGSQGDLDSTPAKLRPLADTPGLLIGPPQFAVPTATYAPRKASEAVDRVPKAHCEDAGGRPLRRDQRRAPRPGGKRCDSGAHERPG